MALDSEKDLIRTLQQMLPEVRECVLEVLEWALKDETRLASLTSERMSSLVTSLLAARAFDSQAAAETAALLSSRGH